MRLPWGVIATIIAMVILLGLVSFVFRFTEILGFGNKERPGKEPSENIQSEVSVPEGYLIAMPNFVGRMRTDVENNAQYSDFNIVFEEANNSEYVEGMIFEQSVKYKSEVEKGSTVVLKVSKGHEKIEMPNLIGMDLDEATAKLYELGINFQLIPNYSAEYEYNIIYDQSVAAETEVAVGDRMNKVFVYYGALQGSAGNIWNEDEEEKNTGIRDIVG